LGILSEHLLFFVSSIDGTLTMIPACAFRIDEEKLQNIEKIIQGLKKTVDSQRF